MKQVGRQKSIFRLALMTILLLVVAGCNVSQREEQEKVTTEEETGRILNSSNITQQASEEIIIVSENNVSDEASAPVQARFNETIMNEIEFKEKIMNSEYLANDEGLSTLIQDWDELEEQDKEIIRLGYSRFFYNMESESGTYSSKVFFDTDYNEKYKDLKYEEKKNFDCNYNIGFQTALYDTLAIPNNTVYLCVFKGGMGGSVNHETIYAPLDSLSIISYKENGTNRYHVICEFQGEDVIAPNTYFSVFSGSYIDKEVSDFSVTPVKKYLSRCGYTVENDGSSLNISVFDDTKNYDK